MVDKIILKILIEDRGLMLEFMDRIKPNDLPSPGNIIFQTMVDIITEGKDVSLAVLNHRLPQLKRYLGEVMNTETDSETVENLLPILKEGTVRRNCKDLAVGILKQVEKEKPEKVVEYITNRSLNLVDDSTDKLETIAEVFEQNLDLDNLKLREFVGRRTGLEKLDRLTLGFEDSSFNTIAGLPGTGKSELGRQIVYNSIKSGDPCIVFSAEETKKQYHQKLMCLVTKIPLFKIKKETFSSGELRRAREYKEHLLKLPLVLLHKGITGMSAIYKNVRYYQLKTGRNPMVVIDHLNLIGEQTTEDITKLTRSMKLMVTGLNVPLMLLCQLNRSIENREDTTPRLADLRQSGSIGQDSDRVMFLTSNVVDDSPERKTTLWIRKQREGATGIVKLINQTQVQTFVEV